MENFNGALENYKNHESLAQWIFSHLQYIAHQEYGTYSKYSEGSGQASSTYTAMSLQSWIFG